jgi:predicted DNA binding CopG/RHH family protein
MKQNIIKGESKMRNEYDFSQSVRNPYVKKLKKQVTIRIDNETIEYFKKLATETDIPYQKLINLFLRDCARNKKKPSITWETTSS